MRIPTSSGVKIGRQTSIGLSTSQTDLAVQMTSGAIDLADKWVKEKEQAELQEAQNNKIKALNDWKANNFTKEGKDAAGITKSYVEEMNKLDNDISSKLSKRSAGQFKQWSTQLNESDRLSVMMHEKKQDDFVKKTAFEEGVNLSSELVRKDAKNWRQGLSHIETTLLNGKEAGIIREEEFETKKTEYVNKFREEVGKSYYTQDKHDFMKNINQFGFGKAEVAAYQAKYKNDLAAEERERKSLFAEEARLIYDSKKDSIAQALENKDTTFLKDNAKKLRDMGYKDWAKDFEREAKLYDKTIEFEEAHKGVALLDKVKAAQSLSVGKTLEGSGVNLEANETIKKEIKRQTKLFNDDPAGFVSSWVQGNDFEEIASSRIALQSKQGIIPEKGFKVLTAQEKEAYKNAWETGDSRQKAQIVSEVSKYGKFAPKVLNELDVNGALLLAPHLKGQREIELLVSAVSEKPEVFDPNISVKELRDQANSSNMMKLMSKVQSQFPNDAGLSKKMKGIQDAMIGISAKLGSRDAGADFFDEKFDVEEDADKMIFFPKEMESDSILEALDKKKAEIQSSFKTNNKEMDMKAKWAIRDATWVNTASGFALADKTTGRFIPGSEIELDNIDDVLRIKLAKKKKVEPSKSWSDTTMENITKHFNKG